ncbi:hypothetical protein K8354_11045 [Polaribacter litorisediminis]|uniref:hypothetical protein n=1 Tax=Polaribacter litorisediminis TaxID=1908341 RepID=UPI001CBEAF27|nr:hypothetical protein [Polaribacter litorisediminis]UAM96863.1 hypothetical protein K8354_11045 [Polaribacter litorisediminis]
MDEKLNNFPLYIKAIEIYELVHKVSVLIENNGDENDFDNHVMNEYKNQMNENALIIPAKIAGAFPEDMLYDLKMENASIIRKCARTILTTTSGLKMVGFTDFDYLELIRNEIEEFRILFAEWVKTFDEWNYSIDRWGLFNPPGVQYDDYDIDDDLPFNNPFDDEV